MKKQPCDPMDRSNEAPAPQYPKLGIQNHAMLMQTVKCGGKCGRVGRVMENARGFSPPHGWWVSVDSGRFLMCCSSECTAYVQQKNEKLPSKPLVAKAVVRR